jgi:membrane protein
MSIASKGFLRRAWVVVADAYGHMNGDDGWAMASHVALSLLMAIFPFVIFVTALAGFIGQEALAGRAAEIIFETWPQEVAGPISAQVQQVIAGAHVQLVTISAVVALVLASNGVEAIRTALSRAYRVVDRRSFTLRMMQNVGFVLAGSAATLVLALLLVAVPPFLGRLAAPLPWVNAFSVELQAGSFLVSAAVVAVFLGASHLWLPAGRPPWHELWPGIALTLLLWVLAAGIFAIYLSNFANLAATYAGLASVVSAIFFLYVVAVSLIFGAEFNASLRRIHEGRIG